MTVILASVVAGGCASDLRSASPAVLADVPRAPARAWKVEPDAHSRYRAFLRYYAPVILKQAHEPPGLAGRDWLTNFFFDDRALSNNRVHWVDELAHFLDGSGKLEWQIRPTVYTHAIEFRDQDERSLVLHYHIYHAMQASAIHDWERVEIRLDNVGQHPDGGERVRFGVITSHSAHHARGPGRLQWYENESGKHPLIWQASWSNSWEGILYAALPWEGWRAMPRKGELRFVEDSWDQVAARLASSEAVRVQIDGAEQPFPFHYVFLVGFNNAAVGELGAQAISGSNAAALAAQKRLFETSAGTEVRRVCYELQDTADILPTHWDRRSDGLPNLDWAPPAVNIRIETEMRDEAGGLVIPRGLHGFLTVSIDDAAIAKKRRGYPAKSWFWGTYHFGRAGNFRTDAFEEGAPGRARALANQCEDCLASYWHQHDYFAHSGEIATDAKAGSERGRWLPKGWQLKEVGGFDGRWVQLFDDSSSIFCRPIRD